jgi:hypothetical protein
MKSLIKFNSGCTWLMGLAIGFKLGTSVAFAAVPPLSDEDRLHMADAIIKGKVESVVESLKNTDHGIDAVVQTEVSVTEVIKGEIPLNTRVPVSFWYVKKRIRGWAGHQGQNNPKTIKVNAEGQFYLKKTEDGGFALLEPNGVDLLKK